MAFPSLSSIYLVSACLAFLLIAGFILIFIIYRQLTKWGLRQRNVQLQLGQWIKVGRYHLCIHALWLLFVDEGGLINFGVEMQEGELVLMDEDARRVFYINVEYQNRSNHPIDYRHMQWTLYDQAGCGFDHEYYFDSLFRKQDLLPLRSGTLNPDTKVRGWVAFVIPPETTIARIRFMNDFLIRKGVDISIPEKYSRPLGQRIGFRERSENFGTERLP